MNYDEEVLGIIKEILAPTGADVTMDTEMDDVVGWDSLRHVTIIKTLESHFGVAIPEEDVFDLVSVRAFCDEINRLK